MNPATSAPHSPFEFQLDTAASRTWPHAVAWLAVIAHLCVDAYIWGAFAQPHQLDRSLAISVSLAQVNLLTIWLVLGTTHWIRRVPWSVCGLVALAHLLTKIDPLHRLHGYAVLVAALAVATGTVLAILRLCWLRIQCCPISVEDDRARVAQARQFSLLDLFSCSLAAGLTFGMLTQIDYRNTVQSGHIARVAEIVFCLVLAICTMASVSGLRWRRWLILQFAFGGLTTLLALVGMRSYPPTREILLILGSHWFLVAGTLWIFQMCGYRLMRIEPVEIKPSGQTSSG